MLWRMAKVLGKLRNLIKFDPEDKTVWSLAAKLTDKTISYENNAN